MTVPLLVLKRYPYLTKYLPVRCYCGAELSIKGEYRDKRFNGIETHPCSVCGAPPATLTAHVDPDDMAETAKMLRSIIFLNRKPRK